MWPVEARFHEVMRAAVASNGIAQSAEGSVYCIEPCTDISAHADLASVLAEVSSAVCDVEILDRPSAICIGVRQESGRRIRGGAATGKFGGISATLVSCIIHMLILICYFCVIILALPLQTRRGMDSSAVLQAEAEESRVERDLWCLLDVLARFKPWSYSTSHHKQS